MDVETTDVLKREYNRNFNIPVTEVTTWFILRIEHLTIVGYLGIRDFVALISLSGWTKPQITN